MRLNYVDPNLLERLAADKPFEIALDPGRDEFIERIRQAVMSLPDLPKQVAIMSFFEERETSDIALELRVSENEVKRLLNTARLSLKNALAGLVKERWPKKFGHLKACPICGHPQREAIEKIIAGKSQRQSWSSINKLLRQAIGKTFHPPSLMIYHLKYHLNETSQEINHERI
jgi:hypothetical protein